MLLGVCGGIAAYKIAALTSTLVQRGAVREALRKINLGAEQDEEDEEDDER